MQTEFRFMNDSLLPYGTPVRIYFNLHKKLFSVQTKVDGRWKVVSHSSTIALRDVRFKVSQAGRKRVLAEQRKNVHAFVEGYTCSVEEYTYITNAAAAAALTYNPYLYESFVTRHDERPVHTADYVLGVVDPDDVPHLSAVLS